MCLASASAARPGELAPHFLQDVLPRLQHGLAGHEPTRPSQGSLPSVL